MSKLVLRTICGKSLFGTEVCGVFISVFFFSLNLLEGDQPRDLLNSLLASGKRVELIVALDGAGAKQFAGYGFVVDEQIPEARPGSRSCPFGFSWTRVFKQRGLLLPYAHVAKVKTTSSLEVAVSNLPSFSILSESAAAELRHALDVAVAAAEEATARRREQVLQIDSSRHVPLSGSVVEEILARISAHGGRVLFACWSGPARYGISSGLEVEDAPLFVVFRAPLEHVLSLKKPSVTGGNLFVAVELAQFCSQLTQGSLQSIEVLCLQVGSPAIVFEDAAVWGELRRIAAPESLVTVSLIESLFGAADGRHGLKGVKSDLSRATRQGAVCDNVQSMRMHKRLAGVERLLGQIKTVLEGSPLPVSPALSSESVKNFSLDLNARLSANATILDQCRGLWTQIPSNVPSGLSEALLSALEEWLVRTRLSSSLRGALPPPLSWKELRPEKKAAVRLLQVSPWPLLMLAKRVTPATHEHPAGKQMLGVFAGNTKQWLASPVHHQTGDRGWGDLCIRGNKSDYVLYELGRFAEMIVWGNPFVLELVLIESCKGGEMMHATHEWCELVKLFVPERLLTARAIMQIMSTVQAQLKLLIANGKPFYEQHVALAELLHLARKTVVAKVGTSQADDSFNSWNYWREPIAELEEEPTIDEAAAKANDRDGPACMPAGKVDVEANFEVDKTSLRECLVELDELRPKWTCQGIFPDAAKVQQCLDAWFVPIRLASLNE
jgi:hypothetical protein